MALFTFNIWEDNAHYEPGGDADLMAVSQAHSAFAQAVIEAGGRIVAGEALQGLNSATFLTGTRTEQVHTVDNPLPEMKETLGGFYVVDTADEASAIELAKLCPAPFGFIEVRPIWQFDGSGMPSEDLAGSSHS